MTRPNAVRLGDVARIQAGFGFPIRLQGRRTGRYPFAKVGDISRLVRSGRRDLSVADHWVDESDLVELRARPLPAGAVVFAKIGEAIRQNFRAITTVPSLVDNNVMGVIAKGGALDTGYLYHFLCATDMYLLASATTVPAIRKSAVENIAIPLPSLEEQRRIAAILDQADALRAKRREALAHLDDLTQSIFVGMFVRGGSDDWPLVTIEQIAAPRKGSIRTGPFGSQLLHGEFVNEGVAVLGIDNAVSNEFTWRGRRFITEKKYAQLSRYTVCPGDVLVTIMGTCGRCAVVPGDIPVAINTKHLCCITLDKSRCLPGFMHANFLRHPMARAYLQRTAKGAIMSGLNMAIIKEMPLALPPLALQEDFSQRVAAVQASRNAHHNSRDELDGLFACLQSQAFAGGL